MAKSHAKLYKTLQRVHDDIYSCQRKNHKDSFGKLQ